MFGCAAVFTGCSDDDDDNNGPDGGGPGVLEKKVTKITESFQSEVKEVTTFAYDADGRLTKMTTTGDNAQVIDVTYPEGQIVMSYSEAGDEDYYRVTMTLEDGRATSSLAKGTSEDDESFEEYTYAYSGGYLSRQEWVYTEPWNTEDPTDENMTNWEVKDGNLARVYGGLYEDGEEEMVFTASDVRNNANIDLFAYVILSAEADGGMEPFYFGAGGSRFGSMPSKVTSRDVSSGEVYDELVIEYVTDAAGYVTRITATRDEDGTMEVSTYEIEYED